MATRDNNKNCCFSSSDTLVHADDSSVVGVDVVDILQTADAERNEG